MEEKYLMRESKPEDIQMITELKAMLTERDQVIKKLIVSCCFFFLWYDHVVINRLLIGEIFLSNGNQKLKV